MTKKDEKKEPTAAPVTPEAGDENEIIKAEKAAMDAVELAQKEILYIRAEFENYRKRVLKDQEQAIRFANQSQITDLLGVVDLLDKAVDLGQPLKTKADSEELAKFIEGIELTQRELLAVMNRHGAEFVGKVGEPFDPTRHEASAQQEAVADMAGKVAVVAQRGCMLHGRLIKPANVIVAKK